MGIRRMRRTWWFVAVWCGALSLTGRAVPAFACSSDSACDDGNLCTVDTCWPSIGCLHAPTDLPCDDADPCTEDRCENNQCSHAPACPATVGCGGTTCKPSTGECVFGAAAGACDDGDACTDDACVFDCDAVYGDSCYAVGQQAFGANGAVDAEAACQAMGGHLVAITSADENAAVARLVGRLCPSGVGTIGASDAEVEGVWKWTSGDVVGYANWREGEPNDAGPDGEDYATIDAAGGWNDVHDAWGCYVCELPLPTAECEHPPADCDDGIACTQDVCDPASGCLNLADETLCDDGVPCTVDWCDVAQGTCAHDPSLHAACDDGDPCTTDHCAYFGAPSEGCDAYYAGVCYRAVYEGPNHFYGAKYARTLCHQQGMELAVITSAEENDVVAAVVAGHCGGNAGGIGLDDTAEEGTFRWVDGTALLYTNWAPGEPNDGGSGEDYVAVLPSGQWNDVSGPFACFVCEVGGGYGCTHHPACDDGLACTLDACDPDTGACAHTPDDAVCDDGEPCTSDACDAAAGCTHVPNDAVCDDGLACTDDWCGVYPAPSCDATSGERCYRAFDASGAPVDAEAARSQCEAEGMHLASIANAAENLVVASLVDDRCGGTPALVGLSDAAHEGMWQWDTGEPLTYENWGEGEPNDWGLYGEDYLTVDGTGLWNDAAGPFGCFVCEATLPAASCQHVVKDCSDGIDCTVDTCAEPDAACVHEPDASSCADESDCTVDTCDPLTGCVHVESDAACEDGDACTVDACVDWGPDIDCEAVWNGLCYRVRYDEQAPLAPDAANEACTAWAMQLAKVPSEGHNAVVAALVAQDCHGEAGLVGLSDATEEGVWRWLDGSLAEPAFWAPGEPNDWGAGEDFGTVRPDGTWNDAAGPFACIVCARPAGPGCVHVPRDCDDGLACTADACEPLSGCSHVPDDAACDDGVPCTADACDLQLGCTATPDDAACDDGTPCTADACATESGCTHAPATPGDVTARGTLDVVDVQCHILVVLAVGAADDPPACLEAPLGDADINCDGAVDVTDTVTIIQLVSGAGLDEAIDADHDACPDACQAQP